MGEVVILPPLPHCRHGPVVFDFYVSSSVVPAKQLRLWFRGKYRELGEELSLYDWRSLFEGECVDSCYNKFLYVVHRLIDKYVPLADILSRTPEWMKPPPRQLVREKRAAWAQYKQARHTHGRASVEAEVAWEAFAGINSSLRGYSIQQKCLYEESLASSLADNPKLLHGYIRRKKKGRPPVGPFKVNNQAVSEPQQMVEVLADAFAAVFDDGSANSPYPHQRSQAQMGQYILSYSVVFELLSSLSSSSSPGPDQLHPHFLRSCAGALALPLTIIYQRSLATGCVPDMWKHSWVAPIL